MNWKEFLKKSGFWCWRVVEMCFELLGFIILMLWEVWFITVIAIFVLIAWYFELLT